MSMNIPGVASVPVQFSVPANMLVVISVLAMLANGDTCIS